LKEDILAFINGTSSTKQ
jgi:2-oxoisovalerate dehydrogenase E2 component (dihydrolipoyl transacylase)